MGQNLITFSEQFDNAAWTKTSCTISANTTDTLDPLGGNTADKMIDIVGGGSTNHWVIPTQGAARNVGQWYTSSLYVKAGTKSLFALAPDSTTYLLIFDLVNLTTFAYGTTPSTYSTTITNAGNGWYRLSITYLKVVGGAVLKPYMIMCGVFNSYLYTSDGTGTIYIWGAQEVQANWPGPYVQTTANVVDIGAIRSISSPSQNLILQSESFDNAAWTKASTTVVANSAANPVDGAVTADLVYPSATGAGRYVFQTALITGNLGGTVSVYAKAAGMNYLVIVDLNGANLRAWYNVATGTVGTVTAGWIASIEPAGNGWYRCSLYASTNTPGFNIAQYGVCDADNSATGTANGTNGLLLWGAQITLANRAGTYVQTTTTAVNIVNNGTPRGLI